MIGRKLQKLQINVSHSQPTFTKWRSICKFIIENNDLKLKVLERCYNIKKEARDKKKGKKRRKKNFLQDKSTIDLELPSQVISNSFANEKAKSDLRKGRIIEL